MAPLLWYNISLVYMVFIPLTGAPEHISKLLVAPVRLVIVKCVYIQHSTTRKGPDSGSSDLDMPIKVTSLSGQRLGSM